MMKKQTAEFLNIVRNGIITRATNFYNIYGSVPNKVQITKIVHSAIDAIDDPKLRTALRSGIYVRRLAITPTTKCLEYGINKKSIDFFNRYLTA